MVPHIYCPCLLPVMDSSTMVYPHAFLSFSREIIDDSRWLMTGPDDKCQDYSKFAITDQSHYSSLLPMQGKQVEDIIINNIGKPTRVLDGTAHIGCDSINFATRFGSEVISIESEKNAYDCLVSNLSAFDCEDLIYPIHGDCIDIINNFGYRVDFVYFDPPWGGPSYWRKKRLMLYLNNRGTNMPIYDIINHILSEDITNTVVLKAPKNFDTVLFSNKLRGVWNSYKVMGRAKKGNSPQPSFFLIICHR